MADNTAKKARRFTVVIEPAEEGGYVVHAPALPGCATQGETLEEAKANAKEAVEAYLLGLRDMGQEIPEEREGTVVFSIATNIVLE